MRKQIRLLLATVLMAVCLVGCGSTEKSNTTDTTGAQETETESVTEGQEEVELLSGTHKVEIEVQDYGTIKLDLDADTAPITVTNFVKLAKEGFYDGLTFHRIINGFMIQGGDPNGDGTGGAEQTIKGEFSNNGVENPISHKRGVISMARAMDFDGASSQFFIVQTDATYLDGDYAAFGEVTEGMEIVDKICEETPVTDGNGTTEKEDQPVITTIRVVE